MSEVLKFFQSTLITEENVNRVPDTLVQDGDLDYVKKEKQGFLWYALLKRQSDALNWLLCHFRHVIDYKQALKYVAISWSEAVPALLWAGANPEDAFETFCNLGATYVTHAQRSAFKAIIRAGGVPKDWKPDKWDWVWVVNLVNRYHRRKAKCEAATVALLGVFRHRGRSYGNDPTVLRTIVGKSVWCTRYQKSWTQWKHKRKRVSDDGAE